MITTCMSKNFTIMALPIPLSTIFQCIDQNQEKFSKRLREALTIQSIANEENSRKSPAIIEWIEKILKPLGFSINSKDVDDENCNDPLPCVILANLETGNCPNKSTILIYSHLSITSAQNEDEESFQADKIIYGRDVVNLAALIAWFNTIEAFKAEGIDYPVNLLFIIASMETEMCRGLRNLLNSEKDHFLGTMVHL